LRTCRHCDDERSPEGDDSQPSCFHCLIPPDLSTERSPVSPRPIDTPASPCAAEQPLQTAGTRRGFSGLCRRCFRGRR
jgi:hypothetical protein